MAAGKTGSGKSNTAKSSKNSAASKSGGAAKTSASKTGSNKSTTRTPSGAMAQQRPYRRELGALICLLLAIFTMLGCLGSEGVIIKAMRGLFGGMIGWGYYFVPVVLVLGAVILFFHHGRPIRFRFVCALLLPLFIASIFHLFANLDTVRDETGKIILADGWFAQLWSDGRACTNGGIIGGGVCLLFTYMFSKAGAAILFFVVTAFLTWAALGPFISTLISVLKSRERIPYDPDDYDDVPAVTPAKQQSPRRKASEQPAEPAAPAVPATPAPKPTRAASVKAADFDLPLDDVPPSDTPLKAGTFRNKSRVKSPDEFLADVGDLDYPVQEATKIIEASRLEPGIDIVDVAQELFDTAAETAKAPEIVVEPIIDEPELILDAPKKRRSKSKSVPVEDTFTPPDEELQDIPFAYRFPGLELLSQGAPGTQMDSREEVRLTKERLETTLASFGINSKINNIIHGPSVTRYELELEVGVRLNRLTGLADDIALALGSAGVRIAAIPNRLSTVGIEVPNKLVSTVYLRDLIDSSEFKNASSKLTFAIGKNIGGEAVVGNIAKLPHLLVAGTTGSGKSVCLNSLILSILYKATPDEVKFIMIDPKMVEFKVYMGIPHLLVPVVTEAKKAAGALQWAVSEMMKRYAMFADAGAREIQVYNKLAAAALDMQTLPQIVIVIDELADLMLVAAKEVEESICRIAQMGRAAGIHLVIATQSPRADIITGLMKANIPSRIAFKVSSALESRIILDAGGNADKLMGNGDMLYAPIGSSKPQRIQGTWVSDEERENIVDFIKSCSEADYSDDVIRQIDMAAAGKAADSGKKAETVEDKFADYDELLPQAVDVIFETGQASVSMLQRRLKLGYARAARLVDQMEELHIVGPFEGSKPRQMLITKSEWQEMRYVNGTAPAQNTQIDMLADDYDPDEDYDEEY